MKRIGLVVNPVAGIGGRVGLKGSDGELSRKAKSYGGVSQASHRTVEALQEISCANIDFALLTYPYLMGETEAVECGYRPTVLGHIPVETTAEDTKRAATDFIERGADLILFTGGDGTALDILGVAGDEFPVLGIPAGVKMHSGVFAINPRLAGRLCISFLKDQTGTKKMEVMDWDAQGSLKLFGYLMVPYDQNIIQSGKSYIPVEEGDEEAIAAEILESISDRYAYIMGPGMTAKSVMERLGLPYALLGVDVIREGHVLVQDANEKQLLSVVEQFPSKIVLGIVGGQGFLLGRGNQQISPCVIRKVGKENLIVVATEQKVVSLHGRPLLVDTGDTELDKELTGYVRIITGYRRSAVHRISQTR
ncbi:MAG TPA: ATP-NAD kinase family protein [Methylomirabilota bacterium]|nr:ATP-NAD kinase family protein [Methylomirabilota bacterium]